MPALRNKIRGEILDMPYPFCMINLYMRLEEKGYTDRELINSVLNEMYDEGVVCYDEVDKPSSDPNASKFVFYTA